MREIEKRILMTLRNEIKAYICIDFCYLKMAKKKACPLQIIKITFILLEVRVAKWRHGGKLGLRGGSGGRGNFSKSLGIP